jgi:type I restriction enzyme S subunit
MEQINFLTKLSNIALQSQLRLDPKYRFFKDKRNNRTSLLNSIKDKKDVALSSILELEKTSVVKKGELEEEMILVDLDDIEAGFGSLKQERLVSEIGSDKVLFGDSDIVCSKLTPEKGHFFINDKNKKYIGTTELIGYRLKNHHWNIKFLLYLLLHKDFRKDLEFLTSGKTHPRIQIPDFLAMRIPFVSYDRQAEIVKQIEEKENKISQIKSKIESLQDIIDDVFEKYGYSTKLKTKRDEEYFLKDNFSNLSKTTWLSTRTYLCRFIEEELPLFIKENLKGQYIPFSRYVKKIRSGEYIPKKYYSSGETIFVYLRVNNISSNELNLEEPIFLDESIGEQYKNIAIKENDLILTRSGTVGKSIIFTKQSDDEKIYIPSHHLAVIQLNNLDEVLFLKYYVQSSFGSDFFWAFSTGKSQKEITNWSIRKLPIPAINEKLREKIVSEIQQREEKSNQYKEQIKKLREEIDDLIYYSLK